MPTITQNLIKDIKRPWHTKKKKLALMNCPQRGGICQKVTTISPKKPCSVNRAVAYVRFRRRYRAPFYIICRIRGSKKVWRHGLAKYSHVLVEGGKSLTIPGCKYRLKFTRKPTRFNNYVIPPRLKKRSRSLYGQQLVERIKMRRADRGEMRLEPMRLCDWKGRSIFKVLF